MKLTKPVNAKKINIPKNKKKKKSKFNNKKTEIDGILFDSQLESRFYTYLKELKRKGIVKHYELQPPFLLLDKFKHNGKTIQAVTYKADFKVIWNDGSEWIVDTKGKMTEAFRLKKKLFHHRYPLVDLKLLNDKNGEWIDIESNQKIKKG